MTAALTDRFRFLARSSQREKTTIRAEVPEAKTAEGVAVLRLYDPIDSWGEFWGVSAKEFVAALDALDENVTEIRLHINSPGGEVFEGIAILNALRSHKARFVAVVDGLAASAASFIACGADELVMAQNTELMIHRAWGVAVGPADVMRDTADRLDHLSDNIASIYQAKAGGTIADWQAAMVAETWYSADEAVTAGLADRVDAKPVDDKAKARFDLSVFAYAGREQAPAPKSPTASAVGSHQQKGSRVVSFTDEQLTTLRQQVGVAPDADEGTILAALTEALAERAEGAPAGSVPPAIPEGHVVVPEARLRDLEAGAANGTAAAIKLRDREREEFLDSVRAKYAPANRGAWAKEYDRDPVGTRAHFQAAPEIVALTPIGHDGDAPDDNPAAVRESADYKNWSLK